MKRMLVAILLTGAFLAGYYVGRLPGSRDLHSWAARAFEQIADPRAARPSGADAGRAEHPRSQEKMPVLIDGQTYWIGK